MKNKKNWLVILLLALVLLLGAILIVFGLKKIFNTSEKGAEDTKFTGTKYATTINDSGDNEGVIKNGEKVSDAIVLFDTYEDAINNFENVTGSDRLFCLREEIEADIVTKSYLDFTINPEDVTKDSNVTPGSYSLISGENDSYYQVNKQAMEKAFGSNNCVSDNESIICQTIGLKAEVYNTGNIYIEDDTYECLALIGYSQCYRK